MKALRKNDIKVLDDIDHALKRSGMYIGSKTEEIIPIYIYENEKIVKKEIPQIPGLLKIFDEIISNSLDEAIRTNFKFANKILVDFHEGKITVEDNGRGLPIEQDENGVWIPELIFTKLKAGSNFDDETKGMLVGQNGVGGSLTAIYSARFEIETANGIKRYKQILEDHTRIKHKPRIESLKTFQNFTKITYFPDYQYFNLSDEAKKYIEALYYKRVKDLSFAYPEITFYFKKEKLIAHKIKDFLKKIHPIFESNEIENGRIGVFYSDEDFQQISFVNGANTSRGGTHIDYAVSLIVDHIRNFLKRKHKIEVKPADIKSKLFILLSIRMNNPQFDSQTKERLINPNNFKDIINELCSKRFLDSICKNEEIILPIVESYKLKMQVKENIELAKLNKTQKKIRIDKFLPSIGKMEYLVLCEGDSAQGGLSAALGRNNFSYFPLKGKPLNTLEIKSNKIIENDEIKNIIQILNLRLDKDIQNLTHENILIGADQDLDGNHIKGLLLTFFYRFAPSLIKAGKIKILNTPLIVAKKNNLIEKIFFNFSEYSKFINENQDKYSYEYKKGLGSWKSEDLKFLFKKFDLETFIETLEYDQDCEKEILNWMKKENVEYRKEFLRGKIFNIDKI